MRKNRWVYGPGALLLVLGLVGCSANPVRFDSTGEYETPVSDTGGCARLDSTALLRLRIIEDELRAGRPRAALAYLDGLPDETERQPRSVYLRAEALRSVAEYRSAREMYQRLSSGCLAGAGYHGLGLVDAAEQDIDAAVRHLYEARIRLSADPRVRNDYGYALLLAGRTGEAKIEFETGAQLSDRQPKVLQNLILTLLVEGDRQSAERYARSLALSEDKLDRLQQRATQLRMQLAKDVSDENTR